MKYIIISNPDGKEYPIIFPSEWGHNEIAQALAQPHQAIVAAGFIRIGEGDNLECHGKSSSLNIPSRPKWDTALIINNLPKK